jgi:hypothetical protein
MKTLLPLSFAIFGISTCGLAWNKPGHMVTGAIAYQDLKSNHPQTLQKVITVLTNNPYYSTRWLPKIKNTSNIGMENHDLSLFMYAARWPDDARNTSEDHPKWHYVNLPYKPPGQPASVKTKNPPAENILTKYPQNLSSAKTAASAGRRAIALSWVFHLAGDVHQPLHTTALFSTDFPNGDAGGTKFWIRATEESSTIHLHHFWDYLVQGSETFTSVRNKATTLRNQFPRSSLPQLSTKEFRAWADESFALAKTVAYRNGMLIPSPDEENGEPLPSDYHDPAQQVAYERVALAGYRLADVLVSLYGP